MHKPYQDHLKSSGDLETTYEAVRAGFVALALEKNRRATPFVAEARALKSAAAKAKTPVELIRIGDIQSGLLTAAGVSGKAATHLQDSDKKNAIAGLIEKFLEPAGASFVEELVFRFLLTCGDTLGGSMRNWGGVMAQCKLTHSIVAHLRLAGKPYRWFRSESKEWIAMPKDDADLDRLVRGLAWDNGDNARTLICNLTVPLFRNNVDLCLFNCTPEAYINGIHKTPAAYVALGELKGGIDPAGADEHRKTARTALSRIRSAFAKKKLTPHTFFIGAAIAANMATEIWEMLEKGTLENAANLTDDDQIASVTRWLCSL